jgi:hypothetical protein
MSLRNGSHLPTNVDFVDFATQRNGRCGREKDLLMIFWIELSACGSAFLCLCCLQVFGVEGFM